MSASRLVPWVLIVSALAGCGALRSIETAGTEPWVNPDTLRPASDSESLLLYFQHIKKLSGTELGKEHDNARQAYTKTHSEFNRVRLAMVLCLPNTSFSDDSRALELLDPMVKNHQASLYSLAFLLSTYIQERKKLDGSVYRLQQNVQGLQQNVQGLQQKLDALRLLERSLVEREQGGAGKR